MFEQILYEVKGEVAVISLNRPDKINPLTYQMLREMTEALDLVAAEDNIGAVLLRAEGKSFSCGMDVNVDREKEKAGFDIWTRWEGIQVADSYRHKVFHFAKPVVCEIKGYCLGGGFELAELADIIIASDDIQIGLSEIKLGYAPLPRTALFANNIHYAKELLMLGENADASVAQRMGLVNKVVPRADLETESLKLAKRLARMPKEAVRITKKNLNHLLGMQGFDGIDGWGTDWAVISMYVKSMQRKKFDKICEEAGMKAGFKWLNDYLEGNVDE